MNNRMDTPPCRMMRPYARRDHEEWRAASCKGFTLVEIALAMLAFSLGIMAFYALLAIGLSQNIEAQHQTRSAEFADSVLRGLRAVSDHLSETSSSNEWAQFWSALATGKTNLTVAAGGAYGVWEPAPIVTRHGDRMRVNVYTNFALRGATTTPIINHIIYYRMDISLTNALPTVPWPNRAKVTLRVWEGEGGETDDTHALIFYSEYTDKGAVK